MGVMEVWLVLDSLNGCKWAYLYGDLMRRNTDHKI